jgi:hypothetical protein
MWGRQIRRESPQAAEGSLVTTELEIVGDLDRTPTTLFASPDPAAIVAQATRIAEVIKPLIKDRHLYTTIQGSEHVYIDAWTLTGSMLGVFATTVRTWEIGQDEGYGACVEARTMAGALVGRVEAVCMRDEERGGKRRWLRAPRFQLISMAQTRGASKALRMPLGFVMQLAGYDATPAEEMEEMEAAAARGETVSGGKGVKTGWKDVHQQQRAHAKMGERIDAHGLRQWVVEWCDSKGYTRPMSRPQFLELERAIERVIQEKSGAGERVRTGAPSGSTPGPPAPDPTSGAGGGALGGHLPAPDPTSGPPSSPPRVDGGSDPNSTDSQTKDGDAIPSDDDGEGSDASTILGSPAKGDSATGPTPPRRPGSGRGAKV